MRDTAAFLIDGMNSGRAIARGDALKFAVEDGDLFERFYVATENDHRARLKVAQMFPKHRRHRGAVETDHEHLSDFLFESHFRRRFRKRSVFDIRMNGIK